MYKCMYKVPSMNHLLCGLQVSAQYLWLGQPIAEAVSYPRVYPLLSGAVYYDEDIPQVRVPA